MDEAGDVDDARAPACASAIPDERQVFRDIVVSPFSELLETPQGGSVHRGGPAWPSWDAQRCPRHHRGGTRVDDPPADVAAAATLDETAAWGGPIVRHYGHWLAYFAMRIRASTEAAPEAPLLFASHPRFGIDAIERVPRFFSEVTAWLGVPLERQRLVTEPLLARTLVVVPQSEQHGGPGPSDAHLDRMDRLVDERRPGRAARSGAVYVSRAGVLRRLAGEEQLEHAMRGAGVDVIRPETLPLDDQLDRYLGAESMIFAQGSALHTLQLLGRSLGDIVVIERVEGPSIAEASIRPRARSLDYRRPAGSLVSGLVSERHDVKGLGLPVVDSESLIRSLDDVVPGLRGHWDEAAFIEARDRDVLAWVEQVPHSRRLAGPRSREHVLVTMRAAGLTHLLDEAGARLARDDVPARTNGSTTDLPTDPSPS